MYSCFYHLGGGLLCKLLSNCGIEYYGSNPVSANQWILTCNSGFFLYLYTVYYNAIPFFRDTFTYRYFNHFSIRGSLRIRHLFLDKQDKGIFSFYTRISHKSQVKSLIVCVFLLCFFFHLNAFSKVENSPYRWLLLCMSTISVVYIYAFGSWLI